MGKNEKRTPTRASVRDRRYILGAAILVLGALIALAYQNCAPQPLNQEDSGSTGATGDSNYRLGPGYTGQLGNSLSCTLAMDTTNVPVGSNYTYTITPSAAVPAGYRVYAFGSKDGITDASAVFPDYTTSTVITLANLGYYAGNYVRYFQIRDVVGRTLCQTNAIPHTLQGRNCNITAPSTSYAVGQTLTISVAYGAGTTAPADSSLMRWRGYDNGVAMAADDPYTQANVNQWSVTFSAINKGSDYVRYLVILNGDGSTYCQSNMIRVRVD